MLPNVLRPSAADHVPVLADEVRELLAVRPGESVVDATFGAGGHSRLMLEDLGGQREADRDRSRPDCQAVLRPAEGGGARRATALPARRLRGRPLAARGERREGRRGAARPRPLVDAGGPPRARVLVCGRRAARHAHGSLRRAERGRRRQHVGRARARGHLPALRRGALLAADRPRHRAAARAGADRAHRPARRRRARLDTGAGALRRGPSREARLPGAPHRGQPRARVARRRPARRRSRCFARAAGSPSSASTRSRTGS